MDSQTYRPAKCCLNKLESGDIIPHLDIRTKQKFKQRENKWAGPVGDSILCSKSTFSTSIPPKNIRRETSTARCPKCASRTCVSCCGEPHGSNQCPEGTGFQATIYPTEVRGWERCYQCHAIVEHNSSCGHMTCSCKAQFCYICGSRWLTCSCSDAQLETIYNRVEDQRVEIAVSTARETAEEADVRNAVDMVEALEEFEAKRRAQQMEAPRRWDKVRRQRKERRVTAISRRFRQFNAELDLLLDFQKVWLAERYEFEATLHLEDRQDALDVMSVRHFYEQQILYAKSQQINSDSQFIFECEYHICLAEEKRVECEYADQLKVHRAGRQGAKGKIRDAQDALTSK